MVVSNLHIEKDEFDRIHQMNLEKINEISKDRPKGFFTSIKNFFLDLVNYREKKFNKAIQTKDLTKIIQALKEGARPNITNIDMATLMQAEKVEIVCFLLDYSNTDLFRNDAKNSVLRTIKQRDWVFQDNVIKSSDPKLRMKILDYILKSAYVANFRNPGVERINRNIFKGLTSSDFDATLRADILKQRLIIQGDRDILSDVYLFSPISPLHKFFKLEEINQIEKYERADTERIAFALEFANNSDEFLNLINDIPERNYYGVIKYGVIENFLTTVPRERLSESQKCYLLNAYAKKMNDSINQNANKLISLNGWLNKVFSASSAHITNPDNFNNLTHLFDLIATDANNYLSTPEVLEKNPQKITPILYFAFQTQRMNIGEIPQSLIIEFMNYAAGKTKLSDSIVFLKIQKCLENPEARDLLMNHLAENPSLLKTMIDNHFISPDLMNDISNRLGRLILKENRPPNYVYELLKILKDNGFEENASLILFAAYYSENSEVSKQVELACGEKLSQIEKIHLEDGQIVKLLNVKSTLIGEFVKKFTDAIRKGDPKYEQKHGNINSLKLESVDSPMNFKRYLETIKNTKIVFDEDVYLKPDDLEKLF